MELDERLDRAAAALHQSAARMSDDPARFRRRLRRRRTVGIATAAAVLVAVVPLILRNADERQVATVGGPAPSTGTAPAAGPPAIATPPCNEPADPAAEGSADDSATVLVYFECKHDPEDTVRAVNRPVGRTTAVLRAALEQLVAGPTEEEVRRGFSSIFSGAPPGLLADVTLRRDGTAVIDFTKAVMDINNITTTSRMAHTHRSIKATAFQFPQVQTVVVRIEGSEDAWCDFFAIDCQPHRRADWERTAPQQVRG